MGTFDLEKFAQATQAQAGLGATVGGNMQGYTQSNTQAPPPITNVNLPQKSYGSPPLQVPQGAGVDLRGALSQMQGQMAQRVPQGQQWQQGQPEQIRGALSTMQGNRPHHAFGFGEGRPPVEAVGDMTTAVMPDNYVDPEAPSLPESVNPKDYANPFQSFRDNIGGLMKKFAGLEVDEGYWNHMFQGQKPDVFFNHIADVFGGAWQQIGNKPNMLNRYGSMKRRGAQRSRRG